MSSDDSDRSDSDSDNKSEDINVTGLVATRARRGNAGNLYESLRAHLDDEEIQKELLAEDEADDAEDYEGSDAEDDNDALDSSSDEDDAGPQTGGPEEDLTGEKELLKAERAEKSRKRKAQAAKLVVPAFKKVKLADQVTADDGSISPIEGLAKKTKPARVVDVDGPKRQSIRSSAVANREVTQANLQESAARAKKQKASLQETVKRERANRRLELSLEQRLEKCKRIEKETAKELGRFEREEAERVRLREEALLAKRRKVLEGPMIRTLSTSGCYENGRLKVMRLLHGSQQLETAVETAPAVEPADDHAPLQSKETAASTMSTDEGIQVQPTAELSQATSSTKEPIEASSGDPTAQITVPEIPAVEDEQLGTSSTDHVSMPDVVSDAVTEGAAHEDKRPHITSTIDAPMSDVAPDPSTVERQPQTAIQAAQVKSGTPLTHYLPSSPLATALLNRDQISEPGPETTAEPAVPVVREQAQRSLLILESFDNLDTASTRRARANSSLEATAIAQVLMPDSYPTFTDEQMLYLRKPKKYKAIDTTLRSRCALTTWPGKYRDPRTGVVYADVAAYKILQRMIAGGFTWNSMLECWVGPAYGQMGRPARGVPPGFDKPVEPSVENVKLEDN